MALLVGRGLRSGVEGGKDSDIAAWEGGDAGAGCAPVAVSGILLFIAFKP